LKPCFLLSCFAVITVNCFSQQGNFKCNCSAIGLDSLWADSNRVACYLIPVARDIKNAAGGKFYLSAVLVPALKQTTEKPLLYLHGGPGIATVENVPRYIKSKTWKQVRESRPLVFFDYRGTGFSEPALCGDIKDSLAKFEKTNIPAEAKQAYKISLYKKCRLQLAAKGISVASFNSFQLSEDVEAIRKALQIDKWNVYGVSFGTTVALNLLRNHGKNINAMILDSPFPPNAPWVDFVRPFDTCFKILEKNIANDPVAFSYFSLMRNDFVKAVIRLNKTPARIKDSGNHAYDYTGDDFAWSIWSALLKPSTIPLVPLVIKEISNGNDSLLSKWVAAFSNPNSFGMFSELQSKAILCYESKPKTASDTKTALLAKYPDFSSFNIDFEGDLCEAWQPNAAGKKAFEPVKINVPVLVLSGEYDPVCPPYFGAITARTLSKATFIIVPSASHAAIHADECLRDIAVAFLSAPLKKPSLDCVNERSKINFVTGDLSKALTGLK
jgi:pimeloyl-ACP methyl ester carboxylesterase